MIPFRDTPIEKYDCGGRSVLVKREDLCIDDDEAPPLAKLRGVYEHLKTIKINDELRGVAVFDTRVSKAGWGVAYLCKAMGLPCHCFFPWLKRDKEFAFQQQRSGELGAILRPMRGGRTAVLYAQARMEAVRERLYMLPLGLVCPETVNAHRKVATTLPKGIPVVLAMGTGTIAAGVALGIKEIVYGVSVGMSPDKQRKRMRRLMLSAGADIAMADEALARVRIWVDPRDYYSPEMRPVPFPSSIWYDRKAWYWLSEHHELREAVFYNIGA